MANERYLALERETVFGDEYTTPAWKYIDIFSESLTPDNQVLFPDTTITRTKRRYAPGPFKTSGSVDIAVDPNTVGWFLCGLLGDPTSTLTGTTIAYEHVFKDPDTVGSFSIGIGTGVTAGERMHLGTVLQSGSLEASAGEIVTLSIDAFAKTEKLQTLKTPAIGTDEPLVVFHHGAFELDDTTTDVEAFSLSINNNVIDDNFVLGSRFLPAIYVQTLEMTGSIDIPFDSLDEYKKFYGSSAATEPQTTLTPVKLELLCDTGVVCEGSLNYKMDIVLPRCVLKTGSANVSARERIVGTFEFEALYDTTSSLACQITLINEQTSYDAGTAQA